MNKINWKVRIKNKYFWLAFVSALVLFGQSMAEMMGISIDMSEIGEQIKSIIDAIFVLLALFGVVNDPTTAGITDSSQAMTYETPREG